MVNPIASGITNLPQAPMAADFERPPALPEAAVTVTPSSEARDSGNATTGTRAEPNNLSNLGDTKSSLDKAIDMVNDSMKAWATGMRFDVDPEAQRVVVSIIDSETGDVLRTVPSDAVIRVAKMIVQLQGTSIDTKV